MTKWQQKKYNELFEEVRELTTENNVTVNQVFEEMTPAERKVLSAFGDETYLKNFMRSLGVKDE